MLAKYMQYINYTTHVNKYEAQTDLTTAMVTVLLSAQNFTNTDTQHTKTGDNII